MAKSLLSKFEYLLGENAVEKQAAEKLKQKNAGDTSTHDRLILKDFFITTKPSANDDMAHNNMSYYDIDDNLPPLFDEDDGASDSVHTAMSILNSLADSLSSDEQDGKAPLFLAAFKSKFMD